MLTLLHHPLCPRSRYVRLILAEYGLKARLVEERFWERRDEFLVLNPAGELPVMVPDGEPPVPGATIIAEYLAGVAVGPAKRASLDVTGHRRARRGAAAG